MLPCRVVPFLQSFSAMEVIINQLIERGLVTRRDGDAGAGAAAGSADNGGAKSPNF